MSGPETGRRAFLASAAAGAVALGGGRLAGGSAVAQGEAAGLLVFTYDDGPEEDYTRAYQQAHKPEGVPGCSAVPSARVGGSDDLKSDQIQEMAGDGWEFMTHGVIHRALAPIFLTQDAAPGDTTLYVEYNYHGKRPGDTIEITDGSTSEVATVAGQGGDYITVEDPIQNAYRVADDAFERYTEEVVRTALGDSKAELESEHGVDVSSMIMPYAGYGPRTQQLAPEYYTAVPNAGHRANYDRRGLNPVDRIDLPELSRANFEAGEMTRSDIQTFLNRVASEDVLGILGGHTWRREQLPPDRIRWVIQEAKSRNVDVVTLAEALDRLGFTGGGTTTTTTETSTTTTDSTTTTEQTTTTTTETSTTTETTTSTTTTEATTSTTTTETPTTTSTTTETTTATPTTTETPTTTRTPTTTTQSNAGGSSGGGGGGGSSSSGGGSGQSFDPTTTTPTTTRTPTTTSTTTATPTTTSTTTTTPTSTTTTRTTTETTATATTPATTTTAPDTSTATDGQPGFGWLASLGGLAGAAAYALRQATGDDEETREK